MRRKQTGVKSFTAKSDSIKRILKTGVYISPAYDAKGNSITDFLDKTEWDAIWDTGATSSLITQRVASHFGLISFAQSNINTPSGQFISNIYFVNMLLPNQITINKLRVLEGIGSNFDVLIGMDIITRGDFAVTNFASKTIFSFRMPSRTMIDFTVEG